MPIRPSPLALTLLPLALAGAAGAKDRSRGSAPDITVVWDASVVRAEGKPVAVGTPCEVLAVLRPREERPPWEQGEELTLGIRCGAYDLYRSTEALAGMSSLGYRIEEAPGPSPGQLVFAIAYDDLGARSGERGQASVDTFTSSAVAFRDSGARFRVELEVSQMSRPVRVPPLDASHADAAVPFRQTERRRGRVRGGEGAVPVAAGASCDLEVRPTFGVGEHNCRLSLTCGDASLFGSSKTGYLLGEVDGGRLQSARDRVPSAEDGDAMLDLDLEEGTLHLSDEGANAFELDIDLEPAGTAAPVPSWNEKEMAEARSWLGVPELTEQEQRGDPIEELRGKRVSAVVVEELEAAIPEFVWLTSAEVSGSRLELRGEASNIIAITNLVGNLEKSSAFTDVDLGKSSALETPMRYEFQLSATIRPSSTGPENESAPRR